MAEGREFANNVEISKAIYSNRERSEQSYSVIHISIHPSKELRSKMAPGEVGMSLP